MPFPLPDGICRTVCRPNRKFPRQFTLKDAVRIAVATVENGVEPCQLIIEIRKAVGCEDECANEFADFDAGVQAAEEDLSGLQDAIKQLLEALGIPQGEPDIKDPETIVQRLVRLLRNIVLLYDIASALLNLISAVGSLATTVSRLVESARSLADCLRKNR